MSTHYKEIPGHWKYPMGPYRQAPPEFGGEWWFVNPFTTAEPWKVDPQQGASTTLPPGFLEIFGPRPRAVEFLDTPRPYDAFKASELRWQQDLKYFKGVGLPEWASESQQRAAEGIYQSWEMGSPTDSRIIYESSAACGAYGAAICGHAHPAPSNSSDTRSATRAASSKPRCIPPGSKELRGDVALGEF